MSALVIISEADKGRTWTIGKDAELVIGRVKECGVCVADGRISRRHCAITAGRAGFTVRDLGSVNGTFLNGQRIGEANLRAGDRLRVGFTEFEFQLAACDHDADTRVGPAAGDAPTEPMIPAPQPKPQPRPQAKPRTQPRPARAATAWKIEFCTRCAGSIDPAALASGKAKRIDGELFCAECVAADSTKVRLIRVVERKNGGAPAVRASAATEPGSAERAPRPRPMPAKASVAAPQSRLAPEDVEQEQEAVVAEPASARKSWGAGVPFRRQVGAYVGLGVTIVILVMCLVQLPGAWLNFQRLTSPSLIGLQSVPVQELERSTFGLKLGCTLKLDGGREVKTVLSAGLIAKYQHDAQAREAKALNKVSTFEVVYDTRKPERSTLRDRLFGLPTLIIALIALCWAAHEAWQISKFYRRTAGDDGG